MYTLKDLNTKLLVIQLDREGYPQTKIGEITGMGKSTIGDFLRKETHVVFWSEYDNGDYDDINILHGTTDEPTVNRIKLEGKRYVITSAQNNTKINEEFFETLLNYCKVNNAELIIGTFSYNKNGFLQTKDSDDDSLWYDPRILPYINNNSCVLHDNLIYCGELDILPTAVNPLSGLQSYTKTASGIVPHAKVQLESVATHLNDPTKFMYTTGAVTQRHYQQRKAGQKAAFHHIFGALVVEIDEDNDWFVRQIGADAQGGVFDFNDYYLGDKVTRVEQIKAINWGDIHFEKIDTEVARHSFGVEVIKGGDGTIEYKRIENSDSILDTLKPEYQFCHDTADFSTRNHHNIKDPHFRFKTFSEGEDCVQQTMKQCADGLNAMCRDFVKTVIVESNHDLALDKWLKTSDYREDPANALFFLNRQLRYYSAIAAKEHTFNIFEDTMKWLNPELETQNMRFLRSDESFRLFGEDGIECAWHSHVGTNGSRGSARSFTRVGIRANIGHSHSATIIDGVYQAGVSGKLNMGYNSAGASSWSHSHILTYPNEKRAIVTMKNGKWHG